MPSGGVNRGQPAIPTPPRHRGHSNIVGHASLDPRRGEIYRPRELAAKERCASDCAANRDAALETAPERAANPALLLADVPPVIILRAKLFDREEFARLRAILSVELVAALAVIADIAFEPANAELTCRACDPVNRPPPASAVSSALSNEPTRCCCAVVSNPLCISCSNCEIAALNC